LGHPHVVMLSPFAGILRGTLKSGVTVGVAVGAVVLVGLGVLVGFGVLVGAGVFVEAVEGTDVGASVDTAGVDAVPQAVKVIGANSRTNINKRKRLMIISPLWSMWRSPICNDAPNVLRIDAARIDRVADSRRNESRRIILS
jgi:hypothetical protein